MANKPVDHGETELQSVVRLSGVEELYLIKIPKDVNFSALDGVKLKRFENECPIETLNFKMGGYVLDARCNVDPSGFRAIVNKGDKNGTQIANPFSGHLSLRKVIKIPKRSTSAPATTAYQRQEQCTDLQLPQLPVGSLTGVDELKERLRGDTGGISKALLKKSKKRKNELQETDTVEIVPESSKEKKKKKSSSSAKTQ